jgi:2-polyprenyl-3-methyl-5-hydroxy-6-metoxy-1,4-benzoquinol methylase
MVELTDKTVLENFVAHVVDQNPMHVNFITSALGRADADTLQRLNQYLDYCLSNGLDMASLADCYNTISRDTFREEMYFRSKKKYRYSKFSEVAEAVYFNEEYMKKYMYGLALTSFIWPNHVAMHNFFIATFPKGLTGNYLEVGPGHGYYFMQAASLGNFEKLVGVDISPASVALTRDIIRHFGFDRDRQIDLREADFLAMVATPEPYSCIVMGEVLEHVEEPDRFLRAIAALSGADTHIYVTTCINAPAVDHIYLFRDPAAIEQMARDSGLTVVDALCVPYANHTLEQSLAKSLPVNVAYVLRRS